MIVVDPLLDKIAVLLRLLAQFIRFRIRGDASQIVVDLVSLDAARVEVRDKVGYARTDRKFGGTKSGFMLSGPGGDSIASARDHHFG